MYRDATMILVAYRHGLRSSELVDLRWDQIDFAAATLAVRRSKRGSQSTHAILGDELRALRRLQREQDPKSPFVFTSECGSPFTTAGFASMIERAGVEAGLGFKAHPRMLRHACGFALANKGHDTRALQTYLGHRNIQHTERYSELSPQRFKDFWRWSPRLVHAHTDVRLPPNSSAKAYVAGLRMWANKRLLHRSKRPLGSITQPAAILAGARSHASPTGIAYR
jgi:integrase